uniref:F-box domain-containing protein n=1 Tax=Percolomonas cosmopolitus TaxID=63605 RepID=A0A7S1PFU3_9EUKA
MFHKRSCDALNSPELLTEVLSYLPMRDLLSVMITCSALYHFCPMEVPVSVTLASMPNITGWNSTTCAVEQEIFLMKWRHIRSFRVSQFHHLHFVKFLMSSQNDFSLHFQSSCPLAKWKWSLLLQFKCLTSLTLSWDRFAQIQKLPDSQIQRGLRSVRTLKLLFSLQQDTTSKFKGSRNMRLIMCVMPLEHLELIRVDFCESAYLFGVLKYCTKLISLRCDFMEQRFLWSCIARNPKLKHLILGSFGEIAPRPIPEGLVLNLQSLFLKGDILFGGRHKISVKRLKYRANELRTEACERFCTLKTFERGNLIVQKSVQEVELLQCPILDYNFNDLLEGCSHFHNVKYVEIHYTGFISRKAKKKAAFYTFLRFLRKDIVINFLNDNHGASPNNYLMSVTKELIQTCPCPERFLHHGVPLIHIDIEMGGEDTCLLCSRKATFHEQREKKMTCVCHVCVRGSMIQRARTFEESVAKEAIGIMKQSHIDEPQSVIKIPPREIVNTGCRCVVS